MSSSPYDDDPRGPDAPGAAAPQCPRHPGRVAFVACVGCRRPTCLECQAGTTADGRAVCVDCAADIAQGRDGGPGPTRRPGAGELLRTTPPVLAVLIGLNVVLYAGQWLLPFAGVDLTSLGWYAGLHTSHVLFEPWRMLTSGFLHLPANPLHLLLNMAALWMLGRELVRMLGTPRFLALYLLCAVGGSVAVLWFSDPFVPVVGASGAVYGLFAALLFTARRRGADVRSLAVVLALNLVASFAIPDISWQGHLGGLVTGAALAPALRSRSRGVAVAGMLATAAALALLTWLGADRLTPAAILG